MEAFTPRVILACISLIVAVLSFAFSVYNYIETQKDMREELKERLKEKGNENRSDCN